MTEHTKMMMFLKAIYMLSYAVIQCGYIIAWTLTSIEFAGGPCSADDALKNVMKEINDGLNNRMNDAIKGEN